MKKSIYIFSTILVLCSCKNEETTPEKVESSLISVTESQFTASKMEIATPVEYDFDVTIKTSGSIDVPPQYRAKVTPFLGGYVSATKLLVGDKVTKGQALITLENTAYLDLQKEYVEVAEQINYLKSEFDRQKTLYTEKITSQKNYLKAESDYRQAKGMYLGLREKLLLLHLNPSNVERGIFTSKITITAPISGDVTVMNANVGMFMAPSDVILEIVDTNYLHLNLSIFEKDILNVKEGQNITFKVTEASNEVFRSSVQKVGKSIENKDRTVSVIGVLTAEVKHKLLSGMFVEAFIVTASKKGMAVPNDAVFSANNKKYVLVLEPNTHYKFKKVAVEVGEKNEQFSEIIPNNSVTLKSQILTKGVFDITN